MLDEFATQYAPAGFAEMALCPAYGLAEATVGVAAVRPQEPWRGVDLDSEALATGVWKPDADGDLRLVSNGRPLDGVEVRVTPEADRDIGLLQVRGPSLASGCVGAGTVAIEDGWLTTSDLGRVDESGEVFVVGRADDVIVMAGRNLHPEQIEAGIAREGLVRASNCVAVPDGAGYAVVAERPGRRVVDSDRGTCSAIRSSAVREVGIGPVRVVLVERGWLPRTVTGKVRRRAVRDALGRSEVPAYFTVGFDGRD